MIGLPQLAALLRPLDHQHRCGADGELVLLAGTHGVIDRSLNIKLRLVDREARRGLVIRGCVARVPHGDALKIQRAPVDEEIELLRKLCGLRTAGGGAA
jgi:hypothetical protein